MYHREGPRDQKRLKLNGTHQLLAYADGVKCSGRKRGHHTEKHRSALLDATKEVGLEVNLEKTECMLMSCYKKA
jgi:hypothetical protein